MNLKKILALVILVASAQSGFALDNFDWSNIGSSKPKENFYNKDQYVTEQDETRRDFFNQLNEDGSVDSTDGNAQRPLDSVYSCPLFSNSPYDDMIKSIDAMRANLNKIIPDCRETQSNYFGASDQQSNNVNPSNRLQRENKKWNGSNNSLLEQASVFQKQIQDIKNVQTNPLLLKNVNAETAMKMATDFQDILRQAADSQTRACYDSEDKFQSSIFSISEAINSIAPAVLAMAAESPQSAIASQVIGAVAGVQTMTDSVLSIQKILKNANIYNMQNPQTRINMIKSTCQIMKIYHRIKFLRLANSPSGFSDIEKKFSEKITQMSNQLDTAKKNKNLVSFQHLNTRGVKFNQSFSTDALSADTVVESQVDAKDELYSFIAKNIKTEIEKIRMKQQVLDAQTDGKSESLIKLNQETILSSVRSDKSLKKMISSIMSFGHSEEKQDSNQSALDLHYNLMMKISGSLQSANADFGTLCKSYLEAINTVLNDGLKNILIYERSQSNGLDLSEKNQKLQIQQLDTVVLAKQKRIQDEKINFNSMKVLAEVGMESFQASEVEKRLADLVEMIFKGPKFKNIYVESKSDAGQSVWSVVNRAAVYFLNQNGPIFGLLQNNEEFFKTARQQAESAIHILLDYEKRYLVNEEQLKNPIRDPKNSRFVNPNYVSPASFESDRFLSAAYDFIHLNKKNLEKDFGKYMSVCRQIEIAKNKFRLSLVHLRNSEATCDMINPALNAEPDVAQGLLKYCQQTNSPSAIQNQYMSLYGIGPETGRPLDLYRKTFKYSTNATVNKLSNIQKDLSCELKSGFNVK